MDRRAPSRCPESCRRSGGSKTCAVSRGRPAGRRDGPVVCPKHPAREGAASGHNSRLRDEWRAVTAAPRRAAESNYLRLDGGILHQVADRRRRARKRSDRLLHGNGLSSASRCRCHSRRTQCRFCCPRGSHARQVADRLSAERPSDQCRSDRDPGRGVGRRGEGRQG